MPDKICAQCGRKFMVPNPREWVYRQRKREPGDDRILTFCTRTCQRKYQEEHPKRKEYNKWG